MAKASLPILPFPDEINHATFGSYISGLTDGEGCFFLGIRNYRHKANLSYFPIALFNLTLRADDLPVLRLIHSFFRCGGICHNSSRRQSPLCHFRISKIADLTVTIIPHFETHPLYAKKQRDFQIWCEGVRYIHQATSLRDAHPRKGQRGRWAIPIWTKERLDHFRTLSDRLREQRIYRAPDLPLTAPTPPNEPSLFDDLLPEDD